MVMCIIISLSSYYRKVTAMKNRNALYRMSALALALILFMIGVFLWFHFRTPASSSARTVDRKMAGQVEQKWEFYTVASAAELKGGVMIYPDDHEDPLEYESLAQTLARHGFEVRVAKYPMGLARLSRSDRKDFFDSSSQTGWVAIGLGSGAEKACIAADRSERVAGLILIGGCSSQANLNDNDVKIVLYQLADRQSSENTIEEIKGKLPTDTVYLTAPNRESVLAELTTGEDSLLADSDFDLAEQIRHMLVSKITSSKNRD